MYPAILGVANKKMVCNFWLYLTVAHFGQVTNNVRHFVTALRHLPPEIQMKVRLIYYDDLAYAFFMSTGVAAAATLAGLFV